MTLLRTGYNMLAKKEDFVGRKTMISRYIDLPYVDVKTSYRRVFGVIAKTVDISSGR